MAFVRWLLHDPEAVLPNWSLPINPTRVDAPGVEPQFVSARLGSGGSNNDMQTSVAASAWTWEGVVYTLAQKDTLESWLRNGRLVHVTDHFGVTWKVQLESIDTRRAGTRRNPEKHKYTVHAQMFGKV